MLKNFSIWPPNNTGNLVRLGVVALLLANVVAAYFAIWPPGGSPAYLRDQATELRARLHQRQSALQRTRLLVEKIESGSGEGREFLGDYFLPRRTAYSTVLTELTENAVKTRIRTKETAYATEPIEGSDVLSMMQISANYEGTYPDLMQFINLLDKSDNLLIIEGLNATPQQSGGLLNVTLKLDTFIREDGTAQ